MQTAFVGQIQKAERSLLRAGVSKRGVQLALKLLPAQAQKSAPDGLDPFPDSGCSAVFPLY